MLKSNVLTICDECGEALTFLVGGPIGVMERVIVVGVAVTIGSDTVCTSPDDEDVVKGAGIDDVVTLNDVGEGAEDF